MRTPKISGTEKQKLASKLIISAAACVGCNSGMCGYAAACGPTKVSWEIGMPLLFLMFEVIVVMAGLIRPVQSPKYRKIYWFVSEILFGISLVFWGTIVMITHLS